MSCSYVHTTQESYALTVVDQAAFAEEVQARAAMGAVMEHVQRSTAWASPPPVLAGPRRYRRQWPGRS
jgi:hypothetical protein